jgi:signal transduction histidine kinase
VATNEPAHAWSSYFTGWHVAFWIFVAIAVTLLVGDPEVTGSRRMIGGILVALLGAAYAGLRPWLPGAGAGAGRAWTYLTVVVLFGGLACAVAPNLSVLLFILYSQIWLFSHSLRIGAALTGALTLSAAAGLMVALGPSAQAFSRVGSSMLVSFVFSLMMGIWVTRIIEQSRERADLISELQDAREALGEAHHAQGVTAERERMAREIHDTLAQGFTSIIMLTQTARAENEARAESTSAGSSGPPLSDRLDLIELVARENLGEARALVAAFSPVALDDATLAEALGRLAVRFRSETGVAIDVECPDAGRGLDLLPRDRQVVLLRAAQEALANVRRHARARHVTFRLTVDEVDARVEVVDDGEGFDPVTAEGFGLTGMRDRVRDAGGELDVASSPGAGTRVSVRIPLAVPDAS